MRVNIATLAWPFKTYEEVSLRPENNGRRSGLVVLPVTYARIHVVNPNTESCFAVHPVVWVVNASAP
jgi:hypothetical protein